LERIQPGVIVDSLGLVGRRLGSLRAGDWAVIGQERGGRDTRPGPLPHGARVARAPLPRVVALQYGTKEADDPDLDLESMARYFDETILRIRAAAPTAAVLVLGPPDMATREGGKHCD